MGKKCELLGIFLSLVTGVAMLLAMLIRAFLPYIILPKLDAISIIVLSSAALVLDCYLAKNHHRTYWLLGIYAALVFGFFPWAACFLTATAALKTALLGAVLFVAVALLFDSMINRISTGRATKLAPIVCGFGIYLAAQCLMGII